MEWLAPILGIVGVVLGASVALYAGIVRSNADFRREASLRRELAAREAITNFLEAAEQMERAALMRHFQWEWKDEHLSSDMWFRQKAVHICCSKATSKAAADYAAKLHDALYGAAITRAGTAPWVWNEPERVNFVDTAKAEVEGYLSAT